MNSQKPGNRKGSLPNDPGDYSEEETGPVFNKSEVSGRDDAFLRESIAHMFSDQNLDWKFLRVLKKGDAGVVLRYVGLCFRWCGEQIQSNKLKRPFGLGEEVYEPDNIHNSDDRFQLDVWIFVCLLDCYVESLNDPLNGDSWDNAAKNLNFHPVKMLFIMSALITTVVHHAMEQGQQDRPPNMFEVAKCGVDCINQGEWGDNELATAFCSVFEFILNNYANYGSAISVVVFRYIGHKWAGSAPKNDEDIKLEDVQLGGWDSQLDPQLTPMETDFFVEQTQFPGNTGWE